MSWIYMTLFKVFYQK